MAHIFRSCGGVFGWQRHRFLVIAFFSFVFIGANSISARAQTVVDFEQFASAPTFFGSADPPVTVGIATFSGGKLLNAATFLPADRSVVYGTAHFCGGCAPTLTIDFSKPVSDFSMLLLNGWVVTVTYTIQDDKGGISTVTLPSNLSAGATTVSLPSTGIRQVKITGGDGSDWDFFVDNVRFKEGKEFKVLLTNFIPHDHVIGPAQARCGRGQQIYYSGDSRSFSPAGTPYRSRQAVTVVAAKEDGASGIKDGTSPENLVGITRAYAPDALSDGVINSNDDDAVLGDCRLLHETGRASNASMKVDVSRPSDQVIEIQLSGAVGNPLVTGAPATDWKIKISIDTSVASARWTIEGEHDGFPAYEIYINDIAIYTFSPGTPPYSFANDVLKLFPPMDVSINKNGTLPN